MFDKTKEVCQSPEQELAAALPHPLRGFARAGQVLVLIYSG